MDNLKDVLQLHDKEFRYNLFNYSRYGVIVENMDRKGESMFDHQVTFLFTVPAKSHMVDENEIEMSGDYLAKRYADSVREMYFKSTKAYYSETPDEMITALINKTYKFKYKVRDEEWNREIEERITAIAFLTTSGAV